MPNRREFIKSTSLAAGASALVANQVEAKPAVNSKTKVFCKKLLECLGGPWPEGELSIIEAQKNRATKAR